MKQTTHRGVGHVLRTSGFLSLPQELPGADLPRGGAHRLSDTVPKAASEQHRLGGGGGGVADEPGSSPGGHYRGGLLSHRMWALGRGAAHCQRVWAMEPPCLCTDSKTKERALNCQRIVWEWRWEG